MFKYIGVDPNDNSLLRIIITCSKCNNNYETLWVTDKGNLISTPEFSIDLQSKTPVICKSCRYNNIQNAVKAYITSKDKTLPILKAMQMTMYSTPLDTKRIEY